jgi:ADP-heptose:LPS heptosyltransferase
MGLWAGGGVTVQANKGWAGICRNGGVGDNLVASAVLPGLKKRYGRVEVFSQEPQHVVFENSPFVDRLTVHKPGTIPNEGIADWNWIRAKEFEFFVNLGHSMEYTLAFFPAQYQFQWPAETRRKIANKSYLEAVADVALIPYEELAPGFFPTEAEELEAEATQRELGGRFIVWLLRGTRIDKVYPYGPVAVARLIRETGLPVVLVGGPKDAELARALHDDIVQMTGNSDGLHIAVSPGHATNGAAEDAWPLRRSLTLVQHAALVVGPDTGPMWAVAMNRDIPKIVLLSHASPANVTKHWKNVWTLHADQGRVPCWPCHRLHSTFDTCVPNAGNTGAACISDIQVDTIVRLGAARLKEAKVPIAVVPRPIREAADGG